MLEGAPGAWLSSKQVWEESGLDVKQLEPLARQLAEMAKSERIEKKGRTGGTRYRVPIDPAKLGTGGMVPSLTDQEAWPSPTRRSDDDLQPQPGTGAIGARWLTNDEGLPGPEEQAGVPVPDNDAPPLWRDGWENEKRLSTTLADLDDRERESRVVSAVPGLQVNLLALAGEVAKWKAMAVRRGEALRWLALEWIDEDYALDRVRALVSNALAYDGE